jgi:DNA-binding Lrp family transcriptional regulator
MDELDVKILRALISESAIGQSNTLVKLSLRKIAARLGADDMTVSNRFRRLQEAGCMSRWTLMVNPSFFGYRVLDVVVRVQPLSGKADMIRKIKLIHGVFATQNFHGNGLKILMLYDSEESRSRAVELISRITNAEKIAVSQMALPRSETKRLTDTDVALIKALSADARKPAASVAKELGLSGRTVRNRVKKLRRENTLFTLPNLNLDGIPGAIAVYLSFVYANDGAKSSVDRAVLSHFDSSYLWGGFSDKEHGFVVLSASKMADVQEFLSWAREQAGIASAEVDMLTDLAYSPQTFKELLGAERSAGLPRLSNR